MTESEKKTAPRGKSQANRATKLAAAQARRKALESVEHLRQLHKLQAALLNKLHREVEDIELK